MQMEMEMGTGRSNMADLVWDAKLKKAIPREKTRINQSLERQVIANELIKPVEQTLSSMPKKTKKSGG